MPDDPDSDQSISDEEQFQCNFPDNRLFRSVIKAPGMQLSSKLETLRGTNELNCQKKQTLPKKQMRFNFEMDDEVEMPVSDDDDDFFRSPRKEIKLCSDEETISDEEENAKFPNMNVNANFSNMDIDVENQRQVEAQWCAVNEETEALVRLHEKAACSSSTSVNSKSNKHGKGGRIKPKFSFRFQSNKAELACHSISNERTIAASKDQSDKLNKVHEVLQHNIEEQSAHERYDELQEDQIDEFEMCNMPDESESHGHNNIEHSMAVLLDGLRDNTDLLEEIPDSCRITNRTYQLPNISTSISRDTADNEDPLEPIDGETSSTDEENEKKPELAISEHKGQTMADRFQDALGAACLNNEDSLFAVPKTSFAGLFGKLQKVIQTEKETDADFLKKLHGGPCSNGYFSDEAGCIDVKIISKYLDAKLTVCRCHLSKSRESIEYAESPQTMENHGKDVTVIFNPRLCDDVELEVGNSVRIHSPWKEVDAMSSDKDVILSTYFSSLST